MRSIFAAAVLLALSGAAAAETPTLTWVWTCAGTRGSYTGLGAPGGSNTPDCGSAGGQWVQVAWISDPVGQSDPVPAFDPQSLDSAALAGAFGAGFTTLGIGLVIGWCARIVLRAVRDVAG